jgi:predicted dehydrogenase
VSGRPAPTAAPPDVARPLPRLGFLGVGWIGRNRMESLAATGLAEVAAVADVDATLRDAGCAVAPDAAAVGSLDELLALDLDGVVIATPSALHADQAVAALEHGLAVFCQKPLGRDAAEARRVVDAARAADRLLAVDLSYRHLEAVRAAREALPGIGRVYAADLVFHNAYGPDKPWFTQRALSGGGCVIDLGTHLLDLALWLTGSTSASVRSAALLRGGEPVAGDAVEDYAIAHLTLDAGVEARLACSWFLPAGRDCVVECVLYGTTGAVAVRNVGGSFYDFRAERWTGTRGEVLAEPPDDWGGRALAAWAERLASGERFDPAAEELVTLSRTIDEVYAA